MKCRPADATPLGVAVSAMSVPGIAASFSTKETPHASARVGQKAANDSSVVETTNRGHICSLPPYEYNDGSRAARIRGNCLCISFLSQSLWDVLHFRFGFPVQTQNLPLSIYERELRAVRATHRSKNPRCSRPSIAVPAECALGHVSARRVPRSTP